MEVFLWAIGWKRMKEPFKDMFSTALRFLTKSFCVSRRYSLSQSFWETFWKGEKRKEKKKIS